ncbi:MAG: hypothetical protein GXO25_08195 [Euryarchaeota archaeon]|nr:hypothetical protein [Euryarchaeota archaeon]
MKEFRVALPYRGNVHAKAGDVITVELRAAVIMEKAKLGKIIGLVMEDE